MDIKVTMEIIYADGRTEMRQFSEGTYIVGRDEGDIALKETIVSGRHGEFTVSGGTVRYMDQGSTNGSYTADGKKLTGPVILSIGTVIRIGKASITLKAVNKPAAKTMLASALSPNNAAAMAATQIAPPGSAPQVPVSPDLPTQPAPAPAPSEPPTTAGALGAAAVGGAAAGVATASVAVENAGVAANNASTASSPDSSVSNAAASVDNAVSEAAAAVDNALATTPSTTSGGGSSTGLDVMEIVKAPMKDEKWITKCLFLSLWSMVPILGSLNLLGYVKACYETHKSGSTEMPEANLSYWKDGIPLFIAYLPILGVMIGAQIIFGILSSFLSFFAIFGVLIIAAGSLFLTVAGPAVYYLAVVKGHKLASIMIGPIITMIKDNSKTYIPFWIACFAASFVSGLFFFITMPYSLVMYGISLAEFEKLIED